MTITEKLARMSLGNQIAYLDRISQEELLERLRRQAEVQRNILQDLAWKSEPGKDREFLVLRAQCLDDFITVARYAETELRPAEDENGRGC